ncbi:MAG: hypothetical protein AAF744_08680 [Pseudomonadota bacterium]
MVLECKPTASCKNWPFTLSISDGVASSEGRFCGAQFDLVLSRLIVDDGRIAAWSIGDEETGFSGYYNKYPEDGDTMAYKTDSFDFEVDRNTGLGVLKISGTKRSSIGGMLFDHSISGLGFRCEKQVKKF